MKSGERVTIYDKPAAYTQRSRRTHVTRFVRYADDGLKAVIHGGRIPCVDFVSAGGDRPCVFRTTPLSRTFTRPLRDVRVE